MGDPKEFAVVIPVPTFITREQIHVAQNALIDHLDAYTSPRLVEYFDANPCLLRKELDMVRPSAAGSASAMARQAAARGVTVEATYTVGEYDILILSAKESGGLETWLRDNGYRVPPGAREVLASYIRQNLRFFVARVNLQEQTRLGFTYLRPLQVAYESPKFMLPVRLGTVNAQGPQELFVFALTRGGRVETTNYRTVRLPTGMEIPAYVKQDFASFYRAMFDEQVKREAMRAVFLEYAWDMGWCDPCAADPLTSDELRELGVFWLGDAASPRPGPPAPFRRPGGAVDVFVTRLHVRYDAASFPEDLVFQQTGDRTNFQGRYVLRHAWSGDDACEAATSYKAGLADRREREAQTLASLTGWSIADVRGKAGLGGRPPSGGGPEEPWWRRIWRQ